jgi:guanine deaminase
MSRMFRQVGHGRISFPHLAFAAILIGGFSLGLLTARTMQARTEGAPQSGNREVSQKLWVSAQEIKDRFSNSQHEEFMRRAIANSRTSGVEKRTGGAYGAVIVNRGGQVIADGTNQVVANSDPTWHGEMHAIRTACARLKALKLDGCILYTSSEPCPMCLATAYWAGLDGIFYGAEVADSKKYGGFDDSFIYEQFTRPASARSITQTQILRDDAVKVWKEYAALSDNVPY